MKKIVLVAAFLILGLGANAQTDTPPIDTTDIVIKYLLEKVENLEHNLYFERDANKLDHLSFQLSNTWTDILSNRTDKYFIRKYLKSVEENYDAITSLASKNAIVYKYTDEELNALGATAKIVEIYMKMMREWLER